MKKRKLWIWESDKYPHFVYDEIRLNTLLLEIAKQQGVLEGAMKHLSSDVKNSLFTENLLDEIIYNFSIEGEVLQRASVRSSLRKQFEGFDDKKGDRHSDSIVSIQKDVNKNFGPLTVERLHHWHHELLVHGRYDATQVTLAEFRNYDEMYVTSGRGIKTKVHYQAPPAKVLEKAMERFLTYCNTSKDNPVIKSAIAHIWFVQIHPYGDGNGRIARNISNHILSKELGLHTQYFSISHAINDDLKNYGEILEETNKLSMNPQLDINKWLQWHSKTLLNAIKLSIDIINKTIEKTKFYDKIRDIKINPHQSKAINMLLLGKEPIINNAMYRVMTGNSQVTASRQLNDLVKKGILKKVSSQKGRSTAYEINYPSFKGEF